MVFPMPETLKPISAKIAPVTLAGVDRLAEAQGRSRNGFMNEVLAAVVRGELFTADMLTNALLNEGSRPVPTPPDTGALRGGGPAMDPHIRAGMAEVLGWHLELVAIPCAVDGCKALEWCVALRDENGRLWVRLRSMHDDGTGAEVHERPFTMLSGAHDAAGNHVFKSDLICKTHLAERLRAAVLARATSGEGVGQ